MPNIKDQLPQRLIERQQSMKYYHDRNAHDLSPLATGQHVRIQDQSTKKWFPGTISCKRPERRSYEVQTQYGSTLRRNRRHLRPASAQHLEMGSTDEYTVSEAHPSIVESTEALHTIQSTKWWYRDPLIGLLSERGVNIMWYCRLTFLVCDWLQSSNWHRGTELGSSRTHQNSKVSLRWIVGNLVSLVIRSVMEGFIRRYNFLTLKVSVRWVISRFIVVWYFRNLHGT